MKIRNLTSILTSTRTIRTITKIYPLTTPLSLNPPLYNSLNSHKSPIPTSHMPPVSSTPQIRPVSSVSKIGNFITSPYPPRNHPSKISLISSDQSGVPIKTNPSSNSPVGKWSFSAPLIVPFSVQNARAFTGKHGCCLWTPLSANPHPNSRLKSQLSHIAWC